MSRAQTPASGSSTNRSRQPLQTSLAAAATGSRSSTPTLGKTTISLEEWERQCPLSEEELEQINQVKKEYAERPLPAKFTKSNDTSTPVAPRPARIAHLLQSPGRPKSRPPSTPGSPRPYAASPNVGGSGILPNPDPLHPSSISTPQQFLDHFTALTLSTEHEQDSLYRDHLAEVVALRAKCDGLLELLQEGQGEVGEMMKCLEYVEERSESLRGACEDLLEEQTHLLTHTSQISHRLTFFTFLETAQRMLNSPSNTLVLSEEFLPMVKRLEECLSYLGEHRDFKDAELYLIRYQQCMTRSMTLIKIYFVNTIRSLGQEVSRRLNEKIGETAAQALLYNKFSTLASSVRPLLAELESRSLINPDELASLLAECHAAWVAARQSLMGSRVGEEVMRMEPGKSELVDLTRSGCSYLKQTCLDEFTLFKEFFLSGEAQLYGFLESLCDHLYDHLRPRILHEPSLETLCGVCTVLQALMVQDVSEYADDEMELSPALSTPGLSPFRGDDDDYFSQHYTPNPNARKASGASIRRSSWGGISPRGAAFANGTQKRKRKLLGRLHTEVLLKMVLQDAQTRLVFRAQALVSADVAYYAPKEGDLDYPEKLPGGKSGFERTTVSLDEDEDDGPAFMSLPPAEAQASWYPTIRVTLWVLSCLYQYVDGAVFEDLAQEAIVTCRQSLSTAAENIGNKKDKMDGRLFLVRHLLILKEFTAGMDLAKRSGRREWSGITDFLRSLLENASLMLGYSRGAVVRPAEAAADAKTDVDRELKRACEDLISLCVRSACAPLTTFLDQCTAHIASRAPTGAASDLPSQSFATVDKVRGAHDTFKNEVSGKLEAWIERLRVYLPDEETVRVLVPPARNAIVDAYRQFHDLVRAEYDFSTAASIMTPSAVATLLTSSAG